MRDIRPLSPDRDHVTTTSIAALPATAGKITKITLDASAWVAAPTTAQANRKNIVIQNQSTNGGVILVNYSNTANAAEGIWIVAGAARSLALSPAIVVYIRMVSGSGIACVEELS